MHENIIDLIFENCKLRDNEFSQICKELHLLKKLKNLNFSWNDITQIGMEYFADFLQKSQNL